MRLESLRTILALAAIRDLEVIQFDITSAYLQGTLKEEVYMEQPEGYVAPGKKDWVWRLKKGLYGLVQAGRAWNDELNAHMESEVFTATTKDPAIYVKNSRASDDCAAAGFWVDDCVAIGPRKELDSLSKSVDAKYGITGPGEVKWVLGMLLERDRSARTIAISQEAFIDSILARFNLLDATTVTTPLAPGTHLSAVDCPTSQDKIEEMETRPYRELVGALAWLALGTRPNMPASVITPVASIGKRPNESCVTSRGLRSDASI